MLLIHARDPDDPGHHWWELPGGGLDDHETPEQAAQREVTEETGIELDRLGPELWIREPTASTTFTENEKAGLIEHTWFTGAELHDCPDKLLPAELPTLLEAIVAGDLPEQPLRLSS